MAKYGKKAQAKVKKVMEERKRGTLKSGKSGKKVTSRKQAIAIGLSEARRAGAKGAQEESRFQEKSVVQKENFVEEKIFRPEEDFVQLMIVPAPLGDSRGIL